MSDVATAAKGAPQDYYTKLRSTTIFTAKLKSPVANGDSQAVAIHSEPDRPPEAADSTYRGCEKFFPVLDIHKSPLTPLNKGGNYKELLLKSHFEKGDLGGFKNLRGETSAKVSNSIAPNQNVA
jgi:hypothetical protein